MYSHELLRTNSFLRLVADEVKVGERVVGEIWSMKGIPHTVVSFEDRRRHVPRNVGSLSEMRAAPSWQPAREWGPQPFNHKELNSANDLNERRNRFSPTPSRKERILQTLWFSVRPLSDFWPQSCEVINLCSFKATQFVAFCLTTYKTNTVGHGCYTLANLSVNPTSPYVILGKSCYVEVHHL